jgi:hypothetical protein
MAKYYAKIITSMLEIEASSLEEAEDLYSKYFNDEMTEEEYDLVYLNDDYCDHEMEEGDE